MGFLFLVNEISRGKITVVASKASAFRMARLADGAWDIPSALMNKGNIRAMSETGPENSDDLETDAPGADPIDNTRQHIATSRGRPRQLSEQDRRIQLLDAAETMFLSKGYQTTTMNDIATSAAMSKKTLYQVFPSKALLFEALLSDRFLPLTLPVEENGRAPADILKDLLQRTATFVLSPRQLAMTRLMIAEAPLSRDMATALERLGIGRGKGVLEQWLAAQAERGVWPITDALESGKTLFFAACGEFLLHSLLKLGQPPDRAAVEARINYAIRLFLADLKSNQADAATRSAHGPGMGE